MSLRHARLSVTLRDPRSLIAAKTVHIADPDLYLLFQPRIEGPVELQLRQEGATSSPVEAEIRCIEWSGEGKGKSRVETEPNDSWQRADPIELGETVFATADDAPYIPVGEDQKKDVLERGVDWYRLEMRDARPRLVFFEMDLQERDNIPVDVSIFRLENASPVAYEKGMDPVSPPHEVQALPGNKFTTRVLEKGTYLIRAVANHPVYSLRTQSYEVPPYTDPRLAVRAGIDYLAGAGDSWHANTPRRGGILDRVANYHAETSTCIACHPTHFSTRGNLIANANGYPIRMRREIQFLTERLYNNPRPFYGFPEASWSRLISASANVLSRLAALLNYFEHNVSGEERTSLLKGVAGYLKLYYRDRTSLPPDETNGNTPIVSTYEVAFYSWMVFDELLKRTGEPEYAEYRDRIRKLIEQDRHSNMLDLCYQTIALSTIDKDAYRARISANAERILALQRPSGQWAMLFDANAPEAEFQTGHCLYALARAGCQAGDPRIAKGLRYLLSRQQSFGGWFDPLQSYENFRTPFRETQFAVMALSDFYKGPGGQGWGAGFPRAEANPPLEPGSSLSTILGELDGIWEGATATTVRKIEALCGHPDALVRQAAMQALGRVGSRSAVPLLAQGLSDSQKVVQYSAAWALRQLATRKGLGFEAISEALSGPGDRTRWGAGRVFATHFSYLAGRLDLGQKLIAMMRDPSPVLRMQACKALWQWWYWNADASFRDSVENVFLERMAVERDPWVRRNLTEGFYNICDENVRYLYNNWIPLLARQEDRERATAAHQATGAAQARKIARALQEGSVSMPAGKDSSEPSGNELLLDGVLTSLTEFDLRHSDPSKPEVFARIGNDVETIKFYPEAANILEPALFRLTQHPSAQVRKKVVQASPIVRDNEMKYFAPAVVRLLADPVPEVRALAFRFYKTLALPFDADSRHSTAGLLSELLESNYRTAKLAALDLVASSGGKLSGEYGLTELVKVLAIQGDAELGPAALRAASVFPYLMRDADVLSVPRWALQTAARPSTVDRVPDALLAIALEMAFTQPALSSQRDTTAWVDALIAQRNPRHWKLILDTADRNRAVIKNLRVVSLIGEALLSPDPQLARQALEIVRKNPSLNQNPGISAVLAESVKRTEKNTGPSGRETYTVSERKAGTAPGAASLDYGFFVERIMPILREKGPDGAACVYCHATHTILKLNPPPGNGDYTEDQLRENYRSALRVVDLENPENSLILRKPLSSAEVEGTLRSDKLSHGGGARWSGPDHPSYKTLLEWIRGAKLASAGAQR
jgi:HEAT repeat protein